MNQDEFTVDETESRNVLQRLRNEIFNGSDEDLAIAMGRPIGEIQDWLGGGEIDEDAQMKINGIAKERFAGH